MILAKTQAEKDREDRLLNERRIRQQEADHENRLDREGKYADWGEDV